MTWKDNTYYKKQSRIPQSGVCRLRDFFGQIAGFGIGGQMAVVFQTVCQG